MSDLMVEAVKTAKEAPDEEVPEEAEIVDTDPSRDSDAEVLYVLGMRYSTGRGVDHDPVAAHKWFNLAAMMGHEGALAARSEMAAEMSSAEVAEAQRLARDWLWKKDKPAKADEKVKSDDVVVRPLYVRRKAQAMRSAKSFARLAG